MYIHSHVYISLEIPGNHTDTKTHTQTHRETLKNIKQTKQQKPNPTGSTKQHLRKEVSTTRLRRIKRGFFFCSKSSFLNSFFLFS